MLLSWTFYGLFPSEIENHQVSSCLPWRGPGWSEYLRSWNFSKVLDFTLGQNCVCCFIMCRKHGLKSLVNLYMDVLLEQKKKHESQNPLGSFRNRVTAVGVAWHADINYVSVRLSNQIWTWYFSCRLWANIRRNLKVFLALAWFLLASSSLRFSSGYLQAIRLSGVVKTSLWAYWKPP